MFMTRTPTSYLEVNKPCAIAMLPSCFTMFLRFRAAQWSGPPPRETAGWARVVLVWWTTAEARCWKMLESHPGCFVSNHGLWKWFNMIQPRSSWCVLSTPKHGSRNYQVIDFDIHIYIHNIDYKKTYQNTAIQMDRTDQNLGSQLAGFMFTL